MKLKAVIVKNSTKGNAFNTEHKTYTYRLIVTVNNAYICLVCGR